MTITSCVIWAGKHRPLFEDVIESEVDRSSMEVYSFLRGDAERQVENGLLLDSGGFMDDTKQAMFWYADDLDAETMVSILNRVSEMEADAALWLVYPTLGSVPKSVAAFATEGPIDADPPTSDAAIWVSQWFAGRGIEITTEACETLADYVSSDLDQLTRIMVSLRELEDEEVTEEHVYEMVDKLGMRGFFDLPNHVLQGDRGQALEALRRSTSEPPVKLLSILTDKIRMAVVLSHNRNADLESFGVSERAAYMIRKTSPKLNSEQCSAAMRAISLADHNLKGGVSPEFGFPVLESCVDTLSVICKQARRR